MLSHKLPLLVFFAALIAFVFITVFRVSTQQIRGVQISSTQPMFGLLIGCFIGVLLFIQWLYLTEYAQIAGIKVASLFYLNPETMNAMQTLSPSSAVSPQGGVVGLLSRRVHAVVLLCAGASALLVRMIKRRLDTTTAVFLVCASIPVALLGISVLSSSQSNPAPNRFLGFMEPVFIALAAAVYSRTSPRDVFSVLCTALLIVLVVSQTFSAPAIPDYPNTTRDYLSESEAEAKSFGYEYTDRLIRSDWYVTIAGPPNAQLNGQEDQYMPIGKPLLDTTLADQGYDYVLLRTNVEFYPTSVGPWKLLWSPQRSLDMEYNQVYSNGDTSLFSQRSPDERW